MKRPHKATSGLQDVHQRLESVKARTILETESIEEATASTGADGWSPR